MKKFNTGGPAFPSGLQEQADDTVDSLHKGMTLRDYFAAKAMLVYWQGPDADLGIEGDPDSIAEWCYIMADSMLKEREA